MAGRLSADWAELKRLPSGEAEPSVADLARLGAVLRAIGENYMA